MKKSNYLWMLLGLSFCFSCNDDEVINDEPFVPENAFSQSTEDNIIGSFSSEVVMFAGSDKLLSFLEKRFPNVKTEFTDQTALVVINEEHAKKILEDTESYETLKSYWYRNRVVSFVSPSTYALTLILKLQGREGTDSFAVMQEELEQFAFYALKADGTDYAYDKLLEEEEINVVDSHTLEDKNGNVVSKENIQSLRKQKYTYTDFNKGQIAEAITEWLNRNVVKKDSRSDVAFVRSEGGMLTNPEATTFERDRSITIKYTLPWDVNHLDDDEGSPVSPITVTATHWASVIAVYDKTNDRDLYDVEFNQHFPAHETTKDRLNMVAYKSAAYKWKYTAGVYTGPKVEGRIECANNNFKASKVQLLDPVPRKDPGEEEYTLTHYPNQHTLGFSLMRQKSISGGTSGVNAESSWGSSFSYACTLNYDTKTNVVKAMEPTYTSQEGTTIWDYRNIHYIYKATWGSNPVYKNPYGDICHSDCSTKQSVTYSVPNSRKLEKSAVKLYMKTYWHIYEESANPWGDKYQRMPWYSQGVTLSLPIVYRYFSDYRPECYYTNISASQSNWTNINNWLKANTYYNDFIDEDLSVGGRTEQEVVENANRMWNEALESMAKQFKNGLNLSGEHYIITVYCGTKGIRSTKGLYIHDNKVEIVDDAAAKAAELKAAK